MSCGVRPVLAIQVQTFCVRFELLQGLHAGTILYGSVKPSFLSATRVQAAPERDGDL